MILFIIACIWLLCGIIGYCLHLYTEFKTYDKLTLEDVLIGLLVIAPGPFGLLNTFPDFVSLYSDVIIYKKKE